LDLTINRTSPLRGHWNWKLTMRTPYTFKLEPEVITSLKSLAERDNRSFNNYVESVLKAHVEEKNKKKK
jgi:hypothetical protein